MHVTAERLDGRVVPAEVHGVGQQDDPGAARTVQREAGPGEAGVTHGRPGPVAAQDVEAVPGAHPAQPAAAAQPGGLAGLGHAAQPRGHWAVRGTDPPARERAGSATVGRGRPARATPPISHAFSWCRSPSSTSAVRAAFGSGEAGR